MHCMQQLQTFGKELDALKALNTEVVAVSTDDLETTRELKNNPDKIKFSMPMLADDKLEVFKAYRAFDDFEGQPLHGTYLIDAKGMVRFQRISADPFLDTDFIKTEARPASTSSSRPLERLSTRFPSAYNGMIHRREPTPGPVPFGSFLKTHSPKERRCRARLSPSTTPRFPSAVGTRNGHLPGESHPQRLRPLQGSPAGSLLIHEIYRSLQGESTFAGLPCVFIRLTACNLRCVYCDTPPRL